MRSRYTPPPAAACSAEAAANATATASGWLRRQTIGSASATAPAIATASSPGGWPSASWSSIAARSTSAISASVQRSGMPLKVAGEGYASSSSGLPGIIPWPMSERRTQTILAAWTS